MRAVDVGIGALIAAVGFAGWWLIVELAIKDCAPTAHITEQGEIKYECER